MYVPSQLSGSPMLPPLSSAFLVTVSPCQHAPSRKRMPTCPLEGFAFAYFFAGCGISFALAAPMATIFSIMPSSLMVSHFAVRVT